MAEKHRQDVPVIHKKIGKIIKKIREASGLTQREVAEKACMSHSHVASIERGERRIHLDVLEKISNALNVEPADLLQYDINDEQIEFETPGKQLGNLVGDWKKLGREDDAVILLREFRNLTPDQIQALIETVKTFKK